MPPGHRRRRAAVPRRGAGRDAVPVEAIQVDGGAEFRTEFEQACAERGIARYELSPKRRQLNGAVERCNGAWRHGVYAVHDLTPHVEALNPFIDSFRHLYNNHRPHSALGRAQYLRSRATQPRPPHLY